MLAKLCRRTCGVMSAKSVSLSSFVHCPGEALERHAVLPAGKDAVFSILFLVAATFEVFQGWQADGTY